MRGLFYACACVCEFILYEVVGGSVVTYRQGLLELGLLEDLPCDITLKNKTKNRMKMACKKSGRFSLFMYIIYSQ